ncbi:hypothetical protein Sjap_015256 [Stephania japonica]|uniref:Uncharacterized protein n=1 Tax=Stephania japonica TaxID=461633 RepID=A0AAP0IIT0_9MAGN
MDAGATREKEKSVFSLRNVDFGGTTPISQENQTNNGFNRKCQDLNSRGLA